MKPRAVRIFTVLLCCLAMPLISQGANQDQNKKKKKKQQGQQQAGQHHPKNQGPGQRGNATNPNKGNRQNNPNQPGKGKKGQNAANQRNTPKNPNAENVGNKKKQNERANNLANNPNHPNKVQGGKANRAKWETKHYDNIAKGPNAQIRSVTYQKNYRINGAQNWHGDKYVVFRDYHSEWHDQGWWHNHYGANLALIAGGWYFLNAGFWAPAWGYNPAQAYYPYNGPIYAYRGLPPDQVVANVQAALKEDNYYTGEVDGLLGPLTQEALVNYQNSEGLAPTGSIDEPTLESLGMT